MHAPYTARTPFLTLFPAIMLPMFLAIIDQTIVATALPTIGQEFGSVGRLSWIMVSYLVAITISAPVFGVLGDSFGRRRLLLIALFLVAVFSLMCAMATSVEMLVIGRFAQGLGGGGLMTLSHALIGESVPPRERGHYQSYTASIAVTASTLGPVIGGILAEYLGWQSVFLINLPIAAVAAMLVWRLPSPPLMPEDFRFDYPGVMLFSLLVTFALVALEQLQNPADLSVPTFSALVAAVLVLLPMLIWRERRALLPLLPLNLLRSPAIWRSDTLAFMHGACIVSLLTFVPIYLCVVHGVSAGQAGLIMLPMTAGVGMGSILTGRLVSKTGRTAIFPTVGLTAAALSLMGFAWHSPDMSTTAASISLGVTSFFMGSVMAVVQITVQWAAGPERLGRAAASVQLSRSLGAAFGTALVGTLIFMMINLAHSDASRMLSDLLRADPATLAAVTPAIRHDIAVAFRAGFMMIGAIALCAVALASTLPLRRL
ncbi:MFS transporter [Ancylobacter mangrovi]|uniref:MFS transporter n=1 Tax=Ancylobacter mangrovi TaxID=2972472 RepID=A0A9X2PCH9_9HYPH|nr:MFS transporter [Ancylobacter mangrovi]MCS0494914.1 MFS transporter [Ancylobacter mangrovi]MCS0502309.1 MFS transporter [Ancylobacter mangrovi]